MSSLMLTRTTSELLKWWMKISRGALAVGAIAVELIKSTWFLTFCLDRTMVVDETLDAYALKIHSQHNPILKKTSIHRHAWKVQD